MAAGQSAWAVNCATWKEADKSLRSAWAKGYPNEKILKIEQNGEPSSYEKFKATGQTKIDSKGDKWEYYTKNKFCRVPAKVTVQQGANQRIFNVSAIYRIAGKKFVFDDLGVGESEAVAAKGQEAPAKDEIKKMIADFWLEKNPNTKVEKVAISAPELKTDSSAGRWWYYTGADIHIIDEDGSKKKCSNDYTTLFKGEKGKEGVDPSGPWKIDFLDTPSCR
jgi:hypothetical protein